ncbi:MAG: hypothetical protein RL710_3351 [Pseudomonadota bacterium]|jgi:hypothetical protein|nr:hypothetical protein [Rhodoferax sp.]
MTPRKHLLILSLALVALVAVFMLYTQPHFIVQLANQLWACF